MGQLSSPIRKAIIAATLGLIALQVALIARGWDFYQYDFRAYYIGAALFGEGRDPYSFEALQARARGLGLIENDHPFLYPPYMLWAFAPLAWMSYPLAFFTWLGLQIGALACVAWVSLRVLRVDAVILALLMALGLNGALAAVLRSGQITLIMLALVMAGLGLLVANRAPAAGALITLAALPKLWLAPMLGLLVKRYDVSRLLLIALSAGLFGLVIFAGARLFPEYQAAFSSSMASLTEAGRLTGAQNGSALNALRNAFALAGGQAGRADAFWLAFVALIAAAALVRYFQSVLRGEVDLAYLFSLTALSLALAMPRFMIYQWVVVLPALAYVLTHLKSRALAWALLALALVPTLYINRYALGIDLHELLDRFVLVPWAFSNLAVAFTAWAVLIAAGPGFAPAPSQPSGQAGQDRHGHSR